MQKNDSTLKEAIFDSAFIRWCEIAPLDKLLALREKRRALAVDNDTDAKSIPTMGDRAKVVRHA